MTAKLPTTTTDWHEGLVIDYALMRASATSGVAIYELRDIAATWDISVERLQELEKDPEFIRQTRAEMMVLKRDSAAVAKKASLLLESWLDNSVPAWLSDGECSYADKMKIVDQLTKVSGLLEKNKSSQEVINAPQQIIPTLNIVLTTPAQTSVEKVLN